MIRLCGLITIWRWCGLLSSFWWMARWTTAGRTCSILFVRMANGLLQASQIRDERIAFAGNPSWRSLLTLVDSAEEVRSALADSPSSIATPRRAILLALIGAPDSVKTLVR